MIQRVAAWGILVVPIFVLATGCASFGKRPAPPPPVDPVAEALANAAGGVDAAWQESNAIERAAKLRAERPVAASGLPKDIRGPMARRIDMEWFGPLAPAAQALASYVGYRFVENGVAHGPPILISLFTQNESVLAALYSAHLQAGDRAQVSVSDVNRTVSVTYVGSSTTARRVANTP